jgi:hypothetical protein
MRNPDVSVSQIVAVKLAVRLAAELTRSLIHSRETAHYEHRQAGDLSALDRAMFIEMAASATLTAIGGRRRRSLDRNREGTGRSDAGPSRLSVPRSVRRSAFAFHAQEQRAGSAFRPKRHSGFARVVGRAYDLRE